MSNLPPSNLTATYRSYLVRFWQSNEQGEWRASAQCVQTGNKILFGTMESLVAFLQSETKAQLHPSQAVGEVESAADGNASFAEQGANPDDKPTTCF